MKYKKKMQVLSGVLSAIMMVTMVPFEALATEIELSEETSSQSVSLDEFDDKLDTSEFIDARDGEERYIVSEVLEGRDQYTKTFRLNTGERMICEYEIPVHYEDENGVWQEYDNSLEEVTATVSVEVPTMEEEETPSESDVTEEDPILEEPNEDLLEPSDEQPAEQEMTEDPDLENNTVGELTTGPQFAVAGSSIGILGSLAEWFTGEEASTTEEVTAYQNLNSDVSVQITEESRENQMVTMSQDDTSVRWGFLDSNAAQAQMIAALSEEELEGDEAFTSVDITSEALYYEDVYDSVDLQCFVGPTFVKDNFILNDATAQNVFQIVYELDGLTPEQAGDKAIYLKDEEGTIQYTIAAPYMMDNSGECSDQLSLQIVAQKDQYLFVELTADREWLLGEGRTYPVTIDPVVQTKQDWETISSTFYCSLNPTESYGYGGTHYEGSLYVGDTGSYYNIARSAIKINDLPELNVGDKVVEAYCSLALRTCSPEIRVDVHEALVDWDQSTATWENQPTYSDDISEYCNFVTDDSLAFHSFNITNMVQKWYNGENNYGFILTSEEETKNRAYNAQFWSNTYPDYDNVRPVFSIIYRNNKGLESYWSYSSISYGELGTAYINNYSGNLVYEFGDVSTTGINMPVSITHIYNGYMAGKKYGLDLPGCTPYVGRGWKLNVYQTLRPSSDYGLTGDDAENYPYVYTDQDGTDHYFYKKVEDGVTTYIDEDGLNLTLTIGSTDSSKYTITDKTGNQMIFKSDGNIRIIKEPNGNTTTLGYDSSGNVSSVTDGNGKTTTFTIASSTKTLTKMTESSSTASGAATPRVTTYSISSGLLNRATGVDGHNLVFTYYGSEYNQQINTVTDAKD